MEKRIMYSPKLGNFEFYFDSEDTDVVDSRNWSPHKVGNSVYCSSTVWKNNIPKRVYLHRFITQAKDGEIVDHKDGNGLNNTKSNLRLCSKSQNAANTKCIRSSSGFKGVSWHKASNKYSAKITFKSKSCYLGLFDCKVDAAKAYNKAAVKLYGEFASLNNI